MELSNVHNIKQEAKRGIHKAINKVLDDYIEGKTSGTRSAKSVVHKVDYDRYFKQTPKTIKDAKEFLKPKNFTNLLIDISYVNNHLFASALDYRNAVREMLEEILKDRIAQDKDKNKKTKDMKNEEIKGFVAFEREKEDNDVKSFETFVSSDMQMLKQISNIEKGKPINEIKLPILKIEEILHNVAPISNDTYKRVLVTFFKTYAEYIDLIDKRKHLFKINDMAGDIMLNTRVVFNAAIFEENDIHTIKENLVNFSMGELYTALPDQLDIFGIQLKVVSFINKPEIKEVFDAAITLDETIKIMTSILGFKYEGKFNEFHIFSSGR